jgi:Flp pilus assembly protein TadG
LFINRSGFTLYRDDGSSLIETACLLPLLLLLLVGAVDFGRAYFAAVEVSSAAEAGALYGVQFPADTTGMIAAAKLDAADLAGLTPTATYGCECSDGSSITSLCGTAPTCAFNVVNYVEVDTTATYTPLIKYPGFSKSLTLNSKAKMRSAHF